MFIYYFNRYLWGTYHIQGPVLGIEGWDGEPVFAVTKFIVW